MKAILNVEGLNTGAKFLEEFNGKLVEINSLFKNIDQKAAPLANLKIDDRIFPFQLIEVRFIDEYVFIHGFIMNEQTSSGGKVVVRLKPV